MHTVFLLFMLDFILLAAKHDAGTRCSNEKQDWTDPFDPYDDALWVDHLSPSHTLLLNKFNVVKHHVLVVTRKFEQQTDPLTLQDLEATWHVVQVTAFGMVFHCATIAYFCKSGPTFSVDPGRPPRRPCILQLWTRVWCKSTTQACSGLLLQALFLSHAFASTTCTNVSVGVVMVHADCTFALGR